LENFTKEGDSPVYLTKYTI